MLIKKLQKVLFSLFFRANFLTTLMVAIGYLAISYGLLCWAQEDEITQLDNFVYWMIVTASTVGYGDFSPSTFMGKMVVSFWVIPAGLSIFAFLIARISFYLSEWAFKGKRGLRKVSNTNHTVIIGWNEQRTLRLIDLLLNKQNGEQRDVVLCVAKEIENPMPDRIGFVKVESFSHLETMSRANLKDAARIIIDTPLDDVTLTTALFCQKISPNSHKTAYFQDESIGELLRAHCPGIEIIPSVAVEMLAKSTTDPGSSQLHKQLLDSTDGMTQFSTPYRGQTVKFGHLFNQIKKDHNATLIGVRTENQTFITINPPLDADVFKGDVLFYISESRLADFKLP
jgi:voltage-gated potassium channel